MARATRAVSSRAGLGAGSSERLAASKRREARVTATGRCGHGPKLTSVLQGPQPLPAEARGWRLD